MNGGRGGWCWLNTQSARFYIKGDTGQGDDKAQGESNSKFCWVRRTHTLCLLLQRIFWSARFSGTS